MGWSDEQVLHIGFAANWSHLEIVCAPRQWEQTGLLGHLSVE